MEESERGRLYPMKADGSEMTPFIIKKHVLYIGSGDSCGIRIYTDGIYPEHCALTTGKKGKVYFQPLHPTALALVNQDKITKKCLLKQDDVITILVKSFRFAYPANSIHSKISVKTPILPTIATKTISPKRRISSARKSVSPKRKVLPNMDDNLHILCVKTPSTGMGVEQNAQKKKKLSICEKKVRFGPKLTPEEFDKHLPPSSPLRRGSLPGKAHSQSNLKPRLSFQLSPNILKRKKVSVNAKRLSSGSKRSFPPQSAKMSRGSPLVDKSLNIANESSTTFTVNVEVHSGPKSKIETPIKSMPSHKRSSPLSSGDLDGTCPLSVLVDDVTKDLESPVSKNTPLKVKSSSNFKIHRDICYTSMPADDITQIPLSPISKKDSLKSDKSITPDSSEMDKRPLFSEILKKHKAPSDEVSTVSQANSPKLSPCLRKTSKYLIDHQNSSKKFVHRQILAVGSTGHANSPDTIILRKRKITEVDDISDVVNVRRSPRTPRRAKYNSVTRDKSNDIEELQPEFCNVVSSEKLSEDNVKQDCKATPTQSRNSNKFEKEIFKNLDSQSEDMSSIETEEIGRNTLTMLSQHSENIAVEKLEKTAIEEIITPSKNSRKTQEFVPDVFSNLSFGEKSKEKEDEQVELTTGALIGQYQVDSVKEDIKATPNQQRKGGKSLVGFIEEHGSLLDVCNTETSVIATESKDLQLEFNAVASFEKVQKELEVVVSSTQSKRSRISRNEMVEKQDSQSDDLDNFEIGGTFKKAEDMQLEFCDVALSKKFEDIVVKQDCKVTPTQPKKVKKSGTEIIKKQDSLSGDLRDTDISGYSENETDSKLQSFSLKNDEDVKEIKKKSNKQPRKGKKVLQIPIEDEDKKLEDLIKPGKYSESLSGPNSQPIFSTKKENEAVEETKKTTKQPRKGEYSENATDLKSPLIDSPSNEKENDESLKLKGKKSVKRSRNNKKAKVLNDNEEIQLQEDFSDFDESSEKTLGLKSRSPDDVSVVRTSPNTVKTNIRNIDKPLPKKRKVKKDCSAGEEIKSIPQLSPCRRVTRSMAKKCAPK